MYSKPIRLILLIVMLSALQATAQTITNSPYSRYGIGDLYSNGIGHSTAMGGASAAEATYLYVNPENPAANTNLALQRFVFDVGMDVKYTKTESSKDSQKNCNASLSYLYGGFAAKPWWFFTFGFKPYSSIGYRFSDSTHLISNDHTTYYNEVYKGEGGLNEVSIGTAFKFLKMFSVGANGSVLFGTTDRIHTLTSSSLNGKVNGYSSYSYGNATYNDKYTMHGLKYDLGLRVERRFKSSKDTLVDALRISLGAVLGCEANLKSRNVLSLTSSTQITDENSYNSYPAHADTLANDTLYTGTITLPGSFSLGISMEFMEQLTVNANYKYQDWSAFKLPVQDESLNLRAMRSYGLGMQYVRDRFSSKYYRTIIYRVGLHKTETYYTIDGQGIDESGFSFGIGLPIRSLLLNVGCIYGKRGTIDNSLYKERYFLMNFSVTTHSVWFVKRKFK